jgi:hypothetical protein
MSISLFYLFYLKIFKKHTRERYAFMFSTTSAGLVSLWVMQIWASQGLINAFFQTSNIYFQAKYQPYMRL